MNLAIAPLAAGIPFTREIASSTEIEEEPHGLSQESACGFRLLLRGQRNVGSPAVFILAGVRYLSNARCRELLRRAKGGSWLILETGTCFSPEEEAQRQANILKDVFALKVQPSVAVSEMGADETPYISYTWPVRRLVRTFEAVTPVCCESNEAIAFFEGQPVCARRQVGKGGIVYLGTMLGPGLFAEEREAHAVGSAIVRETQLARV